MIQKTLSLLVCALFVLIAGVGCGTSPTPAPTKAAATEAPRVITVVITQTPLPPTATPAQPTITLIPTLALTASVPVATPVVKATTASTPSTPRPAATRTPTKAAVVATAAPTAVPVKFGAPTLSSPIFDLGKGVKDERHFPSDALVFRWTSVGALGTDECYLVAVEFSPGTGDKFIARCGDQTPAQAAVQFTLNQPNRASPNYSSLLPWPVSDTTVSWTVTVVKNLGLQADKVHSNTAPLSPASSQAQFPLKGS